MSLQTLELDNLRCIERAELELHPRLNLVTGPNGSGKTSLLEAVHLLGRGRSFRTRLTERLVRFGSDWLNVVGRVEDPLVGTVGVHFHRETGLRARMAGRDVRSLGELSVALPVMILDPGIHRLVEEGPSYRRRWLDWGVFHVEPAFAAAWASYTQSLRQRNAALRQGADPTAWEPELARAGELITECRRRTLEQLEAHWVPVAQRLLGLPISLTFYRGWSSERSLAQGLELGRARDVETGGTGTGPHRFDVWLRIEGRAAREVLSRGQQKLLGACMALAITRLVTGIRGKPPVLLLDDPAAELDATRTQLLIEEIRATSGQLLVTALHAEDLRFGTPERTFHVEQGRVTTL
ncbi:MAG TPA: DNA replication/repair protein RecF [Dehalococcoidia bacterium]|nr:DNA replication/repair protein RecF [Dehalococcoidia bacterium]